MGVRERREKVVRVELVAMRVRYCYRRSDFSWSSWGGRALGVEQFRGGAFGVDGVHVC